METADFDAGLAIQPEHATVLLNRGNAYRKKLKFAESIADYQKLAKLDAIAGNNTLVWTYATTPDEKIIDGQQAVKLATKVCEATQFKDPEFLDTLAATEDKEGLTEHLKLYQNNKPLREEVVEPEKEEPKKERPDTGEIEKVEPAKN